MLDDLRRNVAYVAGVRRFLRDTLTPDDVSARIGEQLASREAGFLHIVKRAVYANAGSPYRRLLENARIEYDDVERLVGDNGLEGALRQLLEAGIYVTSAQLKGREPIVRPGLEIQPSASDFNNPLMPQTYESRTSGSRGARTRMPRNFDWLADQAPLRFLAADVLRSSERPRLMWRVYLPEPSAHSAALTSAKVGLPAHEWYTPTPFSPKEFGARGFARALLTMAAFRSAGKRIAWPRHVPRDNPLQLVRRLAELKQRGTPAVLDTIPSPAVRICIAARDAGLDISGTSFRVGGEPLTTPKARIIAEAGCEALVIYGMTEIGNGGTSCFSERRVAADDMHLFTNTLAVIERPFELQGAKLSALAFTALLPSNPTILLNAECGDTATLSERDCDCFLDKLGFKQHISNLRSYEKLTSEGVSYLGDELHALLEDVLPLRFGGSGVDYQLVEEEIDGLPRISLLVAPRVGHIDEAALIDSVAEWLKALPEGGRSPLSLWQQTGILKVVRREPYTTATAKVLPLYVLRGEEAAASRRN